jgi:capsular polysaccharide biosynthesis protein
MGGAQGAPVDPVQARRAASWEASRVTNASAGALTIDFGGRQKPMAGSQAITPTPDVAEVRLELTSAEVRQVWALYSGPRRTIPSQTRQEGVASESPLAAFLRELRPLAWRWRRTLALTSVAAMALGAIFLLVATPTFAVKARVLVEQRGTDGHDAAVARDASAFLAGQAEILAGASLVEEALMESKLVTASERSSVIERLWAWLPLAAPAPAQAERDALAQVHRAFSATPVFGTEVIALEFQTQDPASGVRFVQAAIDRYEELARSLGSGDSEVAVRTLAAPTREGSPLWPRPAPVLFSSLVLGLLAGLGLAVLAERTEEQPEADWTEIREAAWAG